MTNLTVLETQRRIPRGRESELRIRPVMYLQYALRTYRRQDLSPAADPNEPECYKVRAPERCFFRLWSHNRRALGTRLKVLGVGK